jgi:hypothetical protein
MTGGITGFTVINRKIKEVKKMSRPNAYDPQPESKYQILCRNQSYSRAWEHCDYAKDKQEKNYLIGEYRLAYGAGWEFQAILLPRKFWPVTAA